MKSLIYFLGLSLVLTSCLVRPASVIAAKPAENVGKGNFREQFLSIINRTRKSGCKCGNTRMLPAPPLQWNSQLERSASAHAADMSRNNYFSHVSKSGKTFKDRIISAGYTISGYSSFYVGENIARGQRSIQEVMDGWFKSENHCKNLMNPSFVEVGVAENNLYWVQDFGGRR